MHCHCCDCKDTVTVDLSGCGFFKAAHRLIGLVVKASASRAEDLGFESHC